MTVEVYATPSLVARSARRRRPRINGYLFFLLPGVVIVLSLTLFPALYGIYISLTDLNLGYVGSKFVGLENYLRFFTWSDLGLVTRNTAIFVGSAVALQTLIGLAVAVLLNQRLIGRQVRRDVTDAHVRVRPLRRSARTRTAGGTRRTSSARRRGTRQARNGAPH